MKSSRFSNHSFFLKVFILGGLFCSQSFCNKSETDTKLEKLSRNKFVLDVLERLPEGEREKARRSLSCWMNSNISKPFNSKIEIYINGEKKETINYKIFPMQTIHESIISFKAPTLISQSIDFLPREISEVVKFVTNILFESLSPESGVAETILFLICSDKNFLENYKTPFMFFIDQILFLLPSMDIFLKDYFTAFVNPKYKSNKEKLLNIRNAINDIVKKEKMNGDEDFKKLTKLLELQLEENHKVSDAFRDLYLITQDEEDHIVESFIKTQKKTYVVSEQNFLVPKKELDNLMKGLKTKFLLSGESQERILSDFLKEKNFQSVNSMGIEVTSLMEDKFAEYYKNSADYSSVIENSNTINTDPNSNVACLGANMIVANDIETSFVNRFFGKDFSIISIIRAESFDEEKNNLLLVTSADQLKDIKEVNKRNLVDSTFSHVIGESKLTLPKTEWKQEEETNFFRFETITISRKELIKNQEKDMEKITLVLKEVLNNKDLLNDILKNMDPSKINDLLKNI